MLLESLTLALVGLTAGFVKTGLPAGGIFLPAILALSFPARASVAILLPYLIVGDLIAVLHYRHTADWREVRRLLPSVCFGILVGVSILSSIDDALFKQLLGALILLLIVLDLARGKIIGDSFPVWVRVCMGLLAGVATALANAAGPLMAIYLLLMKLDKRAFMGTTAVLFCIVNLSKVPFYIWLGLFEKTYVYIWLLTIPCVVFGSVAGKVFLEKVSQRVFTALIRALTVVSGFSLLLLV